MSMGFHLCYEFTFPHVVNKVKSASVGDAGWSAFPE